MSLRNWCFGLFAGVATAALAMPVPNDATASYIYILEEIAPAAASNLSMSNLVSILNENGPNRPYFVAYQTSAVKANGIAVSAAPLKIVQTDNAACPYLGVYHNPINAAQFVTHLGCSPDGQAWREIGAIHQPASQPDIRILPDDSVLYAEEYNPNNRPYVRIQYYGNTHSQTGLSALIANTATIPTKAITLPGTLNSSADGTPEFGRISYNGSILSSTLEINYHYFYQSKRDLNGVGKLSNFQTWSGASDTETNTLVSKAGGNGKIGDGEAFQVGSTAYKLVEAQVNPTGDGFGSWRLFLVNETAKTAVMLNPMLSGGAQSLGNPTLTFITPGNGVPALVFTCYVFGENSGGTPPGGHEYIYPLQ